MANRKPLVIGAIYKQELDLTDTLYFDFCTGFTATSSIAVQGVISGLATSGYSFFNHDVYVLKAFGVNDTPSGYFFGAKGVSNTDVARFWANTKITLRLDTGGTGGQQWGWSTGNNASTLNGKLILENLSTATKVVEVSTAGNVDFAQSASVAGVPIKGQRQVTFTFFNNGVTLQAGAVTNPVVIPFDFEITSYTLLSDAPGSCALDVMKDTYANYPPAAPDSIVAAAPPALVGVNKNQDSTLTGWTKTGTAGDVLIASLTSSSTIKYVTLLLTVVPR